MLAFRLAITCGYPHPDFLIPWLTYKQFLECAAYHDAEPWGPERDDIRQEVFRLRLLIGLFGDGNDEMPDYTYPYKQPEVEDPRDQLRKLKERWQQIQDERANAHRNSSKPEHSPAG